MDEEEKFFKLLEQDSQREVLQYQNEVADHVEITHLPRGITSATVTSLIISGTGIIPVKTEMCLRTEPQNKIQDYVALVRFKSQHEAYRALEKIKMSCHGKDWCLKLICDPRKVAPSSGDRWMI